MLCLGQCEGGGLYYDLAIVLTFNVMSLHISLSILGETGVIVIVTFSTGELSKGS